MASKPVVDAVEARIGATWSDGAGNSLPVFGVNQQGTPPADGSSYIVIQYPVSNADQSTIGALGANVFREEGAFRIVVNAMRGAGTAQGLGWADQLAALFRGKEFGGVVTLAPSPPAIDDSNDLGSYFALSVVVPYNYDLLG